MFGLFKPKPTWRERHKVQDQYSQIAISHGWSIDNFDGHPKDPWYREINLIKSIHVYDWEPSIQREDDGYITDVEFTMRICIWDLYLNAFYIGPPASHTFKDDTFTGGTLKMYEEIWMDAAVEAYKAKMSGH